MRQYHRVTRRAVTSFLKKNGLDPAKMRAANLIYGDTTSKTSVHVTRQQIKHIKSRLQAGQIVAMRPCHSAGAKKWEFVNTAHIRITSARVTGANVPAIRQREPLELAPINVRAVRVGEVCREIRKRQGLSQDAQAKALGLSQKSVSDYERGRFLPRAEALAKIARYIEERPRLADLKDKMIQAVQAVG